MIPTQALIELYLAQIPVYQSHMKDLLSEHIGFVVDQNDTVLSRYVDASEYSENYLELNYAAKIEYCELNGQLSATYRKIARCYALVSQDSTALTKETSLDLSLKYYLKALLQGRDDIFDDNALMSAEIDIDIDTIEDPLLRGFACLLTGEVMDSALVKQTLLSVKTKEDMPSAYLLLGLMYHRGIGYECDLAQAQKYLKKAVSKKVALASQLLGESCLAKGQYHSAQNHFHIARKSCLPKAHERLAYMHKNHLYSLFSGYSYFIPSVNRDKAEEYYALAKAQGYEPPEVEPHNHQQLETTLC